MRILTIVGARPQFIKAAVISRAITQHNEKYEDAIQEVILHTGQHYDQNMSDVFFDEMQIPSPDYYLGIRGSSHGAMTGQMLEKIEQILLEQSPDLTLLYGDTNSTLAGALAAAKLHIPVAHVEAGLRSFNMRMPEEVNRILTDHVSDWLFCPTINAVKNLENEGLQDRRHLKIHLVGDVMYDAVLFYQQIACPSSKLSSLLDSITDGFYLATVHRAKNTDSPSRLSCIVSALDAIAETTSVIFPLHPRTRKFIKKSQIKNITLIDPVGYFDMLNLLSNCSGVFTDSGGLQKEAYFFQKPCATLREETEWVELVEQGFNTLVGANFDMIIDTEKGMRKEGGSFSVDLYGQGNAGKLIVDHLKNSF